LGEETDIGMCLPTQSEESERLGRGEAIPEEPDELDGVRECTEVFLEESSLSR